MPIRRVGTIDSWIQNNSPMSVAEFQVRNPHVALQVYSRERSEAEIRREIALYFGDRGSPDDPKLSAQQQNEQIQSDAKQLEEYLQIAIRESEEEPVPAPYANKHKLLWFFKGDVYDVECFKQRQLYSDEQIQLLILEHYHRERRKFEQLRRFYESDSTQPGTLRERIPEDVRIAVWRRDGGKCARCGSREKLEYDHIVPVSKGGSNTERNIELLCERCNREKGDRIE